MPSYSTAEFKNGLKIIVDGAPCSIVANEFVKPGKGQAFNRVKMRNMLTGQVWEKTYKSGERVEAADVFEIDVQFLYNDGELWHFMKEDGSFEQLATKTEVVGAAQQWLQEGAICTIVTHNGEIIVVTPPQTIEAQITQTDPGVKGDTVSGGTKPALLSTGATVKVPLFVQTGEVIKVNTQSGEYLGRVNK